MTQQLEVSRPFDVFISYAREDNKPVHDDEPGWVSALHDEILRDQARYSTEMLRCFFDTRDIRGMDDWRQKILQGLSHSKILLVCLSENYFNSDYCRWEWEEYHRRETHRNLGSDTIAPVYFIDLPSAKRDQFNEHIKRWIAEVESAQYSIDLRPWFQGGSQQLQQPQVKQQLEDFSHQLWDRLSRVSRADNAPGYARRENHFFVGRDNELKNLDHELQAGAIGVVTALHGLGGQGKTELANCYAYRQAFRYPAGLWFIEAENETSLLAVFGKLIADLGLPASSSSQETRAERGKRVLHKLEQMARAAAPTDPDGNAACLVILDNVSRAELLSATELESIPRQPWLRVIATTRLSPQDLDAGPQKTAFIAIDKLDPDDALELMRRHQPARQSDGSVALNNPNTPSDFPPGGYGDLRRFENDTEQQAAREIVAELDGFTLAVESVAIYLGLYHAEVKPSDYLPVLRQQGPAGVDELLPDTAQKILHRDKLLATILDSTLDHLGRASQFKQSEPEAIAALEYASLLPPDAIVWHWLRQMVGHEYPSLLDDTPGRASRWLRLRRRLNGLRLITDINAGTGASTNGDATVVSGRIHRLNAAVIWQKLSADRQSEICSTIDEVIYTIASTFDSQWQHDTAVLWQLPFLQSTVKHLMTKIITKRLIETCGVLGQAERQLGRLDTALEFFELGHYSLTQATWTNKNETQRLLSAFGNELGNSLLARGQQGDAESALKHFQQSLQIDQQLHHDNPNSAQAARDLSVSLEKLGDFFLARGQQGDAESALKHFQQSLNTRQQLHHDNPNSAQAARDLSVSLEKISAWHAAQNTSSDSSGRALDYQQQAFTLAEQLFQSSPGTLFYARTAAISCWLCAMRADAHGSSDQALAYAGKCLEILERMRAATMPLGELQSLYEHLIQG